MKIENFHFWTPFLFHFFRPLITMMNIGGFKCSKFTKNMRKRLPPIFTIGLKKSSLKNIKK